jgi:hypothetical protein
MKSKKHYLLFAAILVALLVTLLLPGLTPGNVSAQQSAPEAITGISFWSEDFSAELPAGKYYTSGTTGSAIVVDGAFHLTKWESSQRGRIFYLTPAYMTRFSTSFSLLLGPPSGLVADGAAFIFCPGYDYAPGDGTTLDASCPGGYIVAFDTYENDNEGRLYVAYESTAPENRICQSSIYNSHVLADSGWHDATVSLTNGSLAVSIATSGSPITLSCALPDYTPFMGYFGFSASTGAVSSGHRVDNINIQASVLGSFWYEDFSGALPEGNYYTAGTPGSAILANNAFQLTKEAPMENGRIFYLRPAWMNHFSAHFSLYLGFAFIDPIGDGVAFLFCPSLNYPAGTGSTLDATCPGGYIVGFDTYEGTGGSQARVYVAYGSTSNRICQSALFSPGVLADMGWHEATVTLSKGNLAMSIATSGSPITLSCSLPGYQPFFGYFGFSAATGDAYSLHQVDNISIEATPLKPFWTEDFNSGLPLGENYLSSYQGAGEIQDNHFALTFSNDNYSRIFHLNPVWMDQFTANFDLYMGNVAADRCTGDGVAFIFCPSYDYAGSGGGTLNASCPNGYIVGFDTYESECNIPVPGHKARVYIAKNNTNSPRICESALFDHAVLTDGNWHHATVSLKNGSLAVNIAAPALGNPVTLNCALPSYQPFLGYFGFSGAAGWNPNTQYLDNVNIEHPFYFRDLPLVRH